MGWMQLSLIRELFVTTSLFCPLFLQKDLCSWFMWYDKDKEDLREKQTSRLLMFIYRLCCTLCTVSASSVFADGRGVCAGGVHRGGPGWATELGSVDVLYAALCSFADLAFFLLHCTCQDVWSVHGGANVRGCYLGRCVANLSILRA